MPRSTSSFTRRNFVKKLGAGVLAAPFFSRDLLSAPPSTVLRHASFGADGMAGVDIRMLCNNPSVKLVAVAEVDLNRVAALKESHPDVRVYQDWRVMLDREHNNIDSVNVSTPDHQHALMALSAMQLGKHIYCQKPLAHSLHETRVLTQFAREKRLITQMGIQVHSQKAYRQAVALVRSGAIGKVKEVHTWSNKQWGAIGGPPVSSDPVPDGFNWDLWLGGCAERPFVGDEYYHPQNWRKRLDFGTGTLGDMGCHIFDPIFDALALTGPLSVRSESPAPDAWNWSANEVLHYVFSGTPYTADKTVAVIWYDGDRRPPTDILALVADPATKKQPDYMQKRAQDQLAEGSIIIGTAGVLHVPHVDTPRLCPVEKFRDYPMPQVVETDHWADWADACIGGRSKPGAPFDYSGPLTEAVLLGSIAVRFPHTTLAWDAARLEFSNERAANAFVRREYRKGWGMTDL